MYRLMETAREMYELLQDELSKRVFKARLAFDLEPTMTNAMDLLLLNPDINDREIKEIAGWKDTLKHIEEHNKKFVIYGAGGRGKQAARTLDHEGINYYGFCGRKGHDGYPDGKLMGKPVIYPKQLIEHKDEYYAAICTEAFQEIMDILKDNDFPQDHILHCFDYSATQNQYFEFQGMYKKGTAFVDGGCFNCHDDYKFAAWCGNSYSYIMAFEPDPDNYRRCIAQLDRSPIRDIRIVEAGLAKESGEVRFEASANGGSYIEGNKPSGALQKAKSQITIKTISLDDIVDEREIGFIKLDIEGSELGALQGAKDTIMRDKPFLALSAYHRNGDALALMSYLHEIVPEYKFWLRHYGPLHYETVLYASIDRLE